MEDIGRYRVVRQLGTGGMGSVYLAHDPTLERDVALKLLHQGKHADLMTEAKALAALSHPNIVTIFEVDSHGDQDFITMEYLPGRTLREVMQAHAPREVLVAICAKVASALDAAHRAKILHRDIKPENVVVSATGDVKVVDFGIARRFDAVVGGGPRAKTASDVVDAMRRSSPPTLLMWGGLDAEAAGPDTQTAFGTPAYMAPEVLLGDVPTEASDLYSLGVVLYECLAGKRPHEASTLVEVIAQMIDEEPPPIDDALGPLVARMLERSRAARPPLPEVLATLERAAAPRRRTPAPGKLAVPTGVTPAPRRWPLMALAAVAAGGVGVGAWALVRAPAPVPRAPALATTELAAPVVIEPLQVDIGSYGTEAPKPMFVTDVVAKLVDQVTGAQLTGLVADPRGTPVAAKYRVRGAIVENGAELVASFALVDGETARPIATFHETKPAGQIAPLLDVIVDDVVHAIAPGAVLPPAPSPVRARTLASIGAPLLKNAQFTDARPYYEQAVDADPAYFEGWYALAGILAWMQAPEPQVLAATDRALALAPPGPKHELVRGVWLFAHGKFGEARGVLEPIEHAPPPAGTGWTDVDQRELLYYLGEASWHDGRHAQGFDYFRRALETDRQFRPATIHAWEYATARRDAETARYYIGLAGESPQWLDFALGHYAELARRGDDLFKLWAQLVLGQTPAVELEPHADDLDTHTYRIARDIEAGDLDGARRQFASAWVLVGAQTPDGLAAMGYSLEVLGEVLLCAGLVPETHQLVALLAAQSTAHAARGYHRLSILLGALAGDTALVVRDSLTERETRLAAAADADLAGDHARAAQLLGEVVADPTFSWDYPERAALIRNLRAAHQLRQAAAVCTDTLNPALFHTAFLVLRRTCGKPRPA